MVWLSFVYFVNCNHLSLIVHSLTHILIHFAFFSLFLSPPVSFIYCCLGLSAIEPVTYHKRFMQKIREILLESESDPSGDSNVMVGNDDDAGSDDDDTTPLV